MDCRTLKFASGFSESIQARGLDGAPLLLTLRLCLDCGSRFPDHTRLPALSVAATAAALVR